MVWHIVASVFVCAANHRRISSESATSSVVGLPTVRKPRGQISQNTHDLIAVELLERLERDGNGVEFGVGSIRQQPELHDDGWNTIGAERSVGHLHFRPIKNRPIQNRQQPHVSVGREMNGERTCIPSRTSVFHPRRQRPSLTFKSSLSWLKMGSGPGAERCPCETRASLAETGAWPAPCGVCVTCAGLPGGSDSLRPVLIDITS